MVLNEVKTTWRALIEKEMAHHGESLADAQHTAIASGELDREFDDGYGGTEGAPFLIHTKTRVYFPCCYDGAEWCGSVPRHPTGEPVEHIGG